MPFPISDADAGGNPVEVTLSVDQGSISLINPNLGNALTYSAGDGSADANDDFSRHGCRHQHSPRLGQLSAYCQSIFSVASPKMVVTVTGISTSPMVSPGTLQKQTPKTLAAILPLSRLLKNDSFFMEALQGVSRR